MAGTKIPGTTSVLGTLHHLVNVVTELLTIQVTMGVGVVHCGELRVESYLLRCSNSSIY